MKIFAKIKDSVKYLRLRQRMILVYVFGCFLPFILVYFYMYNGSQTAAVEQRLASEQEKLDEISESVNNSMNMAVELSGKFFYDEKNHLLGVSRYSEEESMMVDYRTYDVLESYVEHYYLDVANVVIYLNESAETDRKIVDNRHFKLITNTIRQKDWYRNTIQSQGQPRWSYWTNVQNSQVSLRLSRTLYNSRHQAVGVISIALKPDVLTEFMNAEDSFRAIILNGKELVRSNCKLTEHEIDSIMANVPDPTFDGWIEFRGERSILAGTEIAERYAGIDSYWIVSLRTYRSVSTSATKYAIMSLYPMLIGIGIMIIAIYAFSRWFNARIDALGRAVHKAAEGETELGDIVIGESHDEILDLYNDLNHMIQDMKQLSEDAANERIQKEQLYSRQKDVEFKMLATQINPHFLYNTLENLRMLGAINHVKEVEDISVNLTKILRSSLNVGQDLKTLKWEMDIITCYIKIQNYRFGDRIISSVEYDSSIGEQYMVIPFVVQPFVENAYVHALEDVDEGGEIKIRVEIDEAEDCLKIYVEDNGCGMDEEQLEEITRYINDFEKLDRTHIGICNVNQRIKLRFGDDYGVIFTSTENEGTKVEIRMPLIEN